MTFPPFLIVLVRGLFHGLTIFVEGMMPQLEWAVWTNELLKHTMGEGSSHRREAGAVGAVLITECPRRYRQVLADGVPFFYS